MENNAASQAALITNTLLQLTNSIKNNSNNNTNGEADKNEQDKTSNPNIKTEASDVQNLLGLPPQNNTKPLTIFDRVAYENSKTQQQQIAQLQLNGTWSKFLGENATSLNPLEALPTQSYQKSFIKICF